MGGMSLNPLGESREFNAGLLKPKGKILPYSYGNGMALLLFFSHWVLTLDFVFLKVMGFDSAESYFLWDSFFFFFF